MDILLRNTPLTPRTIFGIDISMGFLNEEDFLEENEEDRPVAARTLRSEIRRFIEPLFLPHISYFMGKYLNDNI